MVNHPSNPFPENELPKWLFRESLVRGKRSVRAAGGPPYKQLASFSHDMHTCTRSSVDVIRGLELCLRPLRKTRLGDHWSDAVDRLRRGSTLAEALEGAKDVLPPFFLPVIKAGEQSGQVAEAFAFLERHCNLLAGPATALRNVWLFPVVIMLFGSVAKVILNLFFGSIVGAFSLMIEELFSWLQIAILVALGAADAAAILPRSSAAIAAMAR